MRVLLTLLTASKADVLTLLDMQTAQKGSIPHNGSSNVLQNVEVTEGKSTATGTELKKK